ncbi:hypothetical protein GCM10027217_31590 [Pseudomaricurvus hydrocarbonicus]
MYVDVYVLSGVAIVVLACVMMGYVGYYAHRHIKEDMEKSKKS